MENDSLHHWVHDLSLCTHVREDWSANMWDKNEGQCYKEMTMGWRV